MIEHVVLFRFGPGLDEDRLGRIRSALAALPGRIADIRYLHFGPNLSDRSGGYGHVLVTRFDDPAGLERYLVHPDHVAVVENEVKPLVEGVLVADVECP